MIVCTCLKQDQIDAVLTGGAVVSIYSENKYQSDDLDFITFASKKEISNSLDRIGFKETKGRYYIHSESDFIVEFPSGPLSIGNKPVKKFNEIILKECYLKLLTPTHCVMDRLAAYYFWNDMQSLDQAILVSKHHEIDLDEIETWSIDEDMLKRFVNFKLKLNS